VSAMLQNMELIVQRSLPTLDVESLECCEAKEALFRSKDGFLLYLTDGTPPPLGRERVVPLSLRQALLWLNENQLYEAGSFWA